VEPPGVRAPDEQRLRHYVLVDGVSMRALIYEARQLNGQVRSLYDGLGERVFDPLSPQVFAYQPGERFEQLWYSVARGRGWGLRLSSSAPIDRVVAHLQRFLLVDVASSSSGKPSQLYLRFYDPRVMHTLLGILDSSQLREFFGPIEHFVVEDPDAPHIDRIYRLSATGRLVTEQEQVGPARPPQPSEEQVERIARNEAYVRNRLEQYGQLTALSNAFTSATPFCSVCACNEFEVDRESGLSFGPAQHAGFSRHALSWYKRRTFKSLRDEAEGLSDEQLRALIDDGVARARRYDISGSSAVFSFIRLQIALGRDFDRRYRWASKILSDRSLDQNRKIDRLRARARDVPKKGSAIARAERASTPKPSSLGERLFAAIEARDRTLLNRLLVAHPALIQAKDRHGNSPLHLAAKTGSVAIVKRLLDAGAKVNQRGFMKYTPLMNAAVKGQVAVTSLLLEAGADVNAVYEHPWPKDRASALMLAANKGHAAVCRVLLAAGADADIRNHDGDTALIFAAREGHTAVVEVLLRGGANPRLRGYKKRTARSVALKKGHRALAELIASYLR
jgi:ankyrin repeat protein